MSQGQEGDEMAQRLQHQCSQETWELAGSESNRKYVGGYEMATGRSGHVIGVVIKTLWIHETMTEYCRVIAHSMSEIIKSDIKA